MPEILALPISLGVVLELAKHHRRGRTMAFWIVNGRLVSVTLSAQA